MNMLVLRSSHLVRRSMRQRSVLPLVPKKKWLSRTGAEKAVLAGKEIHKTKTSIKDVKVESSETPKPLAIEPPLTNPFPLLAHATENIDLSSRLRAFSNNFGIIGALWCTLSITALTMAPIDDVYKETRRMEADTASAAGVGPSLSMVGTRKRRPSLNVPSPDTRIRKPILVKYVGVPEQYLEDIYMACWSASFFTSAVGLGLSTVVAGIVAATAPAYVKIFVRRHSDILLALPVCQGLSSGFGAVGLSVGLDEARGEPVAWIGYLGTIAGGTIVGRSTFKVLKGYNASRAAGKLSFPPPKTG